MKPKALIIAAPRSGSGKTTIVTALLAAMHRAGWRVGAAKLGPDYIDPCFHEAATGLPSLNLDTWAMEPAQCAAVLGMAGEQAEIVLIEAAMGLFDGLDRPTRRGSAAELAAMFDLPVVLVLDASGQGQSVGAVALGFARLDPGVRVEGVILNRVASDRHEAMARAGMAQAGIAVLGIVRRDVEIALDSRHLGLVQAREHDALPELMARLAAVGGACALATIAALAAPLPDRGEATFLSPPGQRIALARDEAFAFIYPHLLRSWRRAGAEIAMFSPLADEAPDPSCDVVWLPGGYPELHAARLSNASLFLGGVRAFSGAIYGECGGYMVLGRALVDAQGHAHPMADLLDHVTSFEKKRLHLGYRRAVLCDDSVQGPRGTVLLGHEFHHSSLIEAGSDAPFARVADGYGVDLGFSGGQRGRVCGSYFHIVAGAGA